MDVLSGHSDFVEMREPYSKDCLEKTLGVRTIFVKATVSRLVLGGFKLRVKLTAMAVFQVELKKATKEKKQLVGPTVCNTRQLRNFMGRFFLDDEVDHCGKTWQFSCHLLVFFFNGVRHTTTNYRIAAAVLLGILRAFCSGCAQL